MGQKGGGACAAFHLPPKMRKEERMSNLTHEQQDRLRSAIKSLGFRADQNEPIGGHLRNFVQIIDFDKLSARNTQIIYGRNGTGKTHLFRAYAEYCASEFEHARRIPVYIDCRKLDIRSFGGEILVEDLLILFYKKLVRQISQAVAQFADKHIDIGILERLFGGSGPTRRKNIRQSQVKLEQLLHEGLIETRIKSYIKKLEVRASEGNPRDFLRLFFNCLESVEFASTKRISKHHVTMAAIMHFQHDKSPELTSNIDARKIFDELYKLVIQKNPRCF
jgi:hypothetical protein